MTTHTTTGPWAVEAREAQARTLTPLTFRIPRGQIAGLIGPSGAGKSTLMRMIVGTQAKTVGSLSVLGLPAGSPALRSRVGYATQQASVYGDLTVKENFAYCAGLLKQPKARVAEIIEKVDLQDKINTIVNNLSGGQRSRVSLGMALVGDPELLVLDEPTVGLDPVLRIQLWAMFNELKEEGKTLIISSHVLDEAEHCDDLLLIREGTIYATTPAAMKQETHTATIEEAFLELMK